MTTYTPRGLPADPADLWLPVRSWSDGRGPLCFIESGQDLPFPIQRVYYMYGMKGPRGGHAHIEQEQVILAMHGSFTLHLDDGVHKHAVVLDDPARAVWAGKMVWREVTGSSPGAVCLVLASTPYSAGDYIRDYTAFLKSVKA